MKIGVGDKRDPKGQSPRPERPRAEVEFLGSKIIVNLDLVYM